MKTIDEMLKEMQTEREIRCPYCNMLQVNDDDQYPVSYWGEDDRVEMECQDCGKKFYVEEKVKRTYEVYKEA